jgi:hypothetical protein
MRVRKVITRSGRHHRGKFPSFKLKRTVHWESMLERDAILHAEYHPLVLSYQEQPCVLHYYDTQGEVRNYVPDLRLDLDDGSELFVEVKPSARLQRPDVKGKLEAVAHSLAEQGLRFRVLTEKELRREPLYGNLQRLHEAVRSHKVTGLLQSAALPSGQRWTLGQFIRSMANEAQAFALLGLGYLRADLEKELDDGASVWLEGCEEASDGSFRI